MCMCMLLLCICSIGGYKREEDESRGPLIVSIGKQRESNVRKDKVLGKEIDKFK